MSTAQVNQEKVWQWKLSKDEEEQVQDAWADAGIKVPKKRKYYHCSLQNNSTGKPCPATLFHSGQIYTHLKRNFHYGKAYPGG